MARRPRTSGEAGLETFRLGDRLRHMRETDGLTVEDTRRLDRILVEADRLRDVDLSDVIIVRDRQRPDPGGITETIKPRDIGALVADVLTGPRTIDKTPLHTVTGQVMERLREKVPGALPGLAVPEGERGAEIPVQTSAFTTLVRIAAIEISEGEKSVIWDDGVNQLVVHPARIKLRLTEGRVEVTIPTEADALKAAMTVPFATGSGARVAGLVMSTLERPAGNATVAQVWGDALIALAHGALLSAVESLAGASGRDKQNNRLIPRAIAARKGRLVIQSQARFALKGRVR